MTAGAADRGHEVTSWQEAPGAGIVRASLVVTAAFTVVASLAAAFPGVLARPVAVVDGVLFVAGCVVFVMAFAHAVGRSRTEVLSVAGIWFLAGSAPAAVRRPLLGAVAVQTVVAVVTASIRLYTPVAFGILVPLLGLGLAGLWGARHGRFPERSPR